MVQIPDPETSGRRKHLPRRTRRWRGVFALALAPCLGCREEAPDAPPAVTARPIDQNLLLVTFDTTRADALGCYGGDAGVSPTLDRLAAEGVVFRRAYAAVPYTLPSHATLLTGQLPFLHGVRTNGEQRLPAAALTLAERLRDAGLSTAAFPAAQVLLAEFGLDQGFDHYQDEVRDAREGDQRAYRPADVTVEYFLAWLAQEPREPFFAWVHFFEPHLPYDPPPDLQRRFASPYAAEIFQADRSLGRILDALESREMLARTFVCATADHGESLDEHEEPTHGVFLYDATMHVPLILRHPSLLPGEVAQPVSLADVAPTLLDLLGVLPPEWQERSLVPAFRPAAEEDLEARPVYLETYVPYLSFGWSPSEALVSGGWKYIAAPRPELFDLSADPRELHNRIEEEDDRGARLRALWQAVRSDRSGALAPESVALDAEELAEIRRLGYVADSGGSDAPLPEPGGADLPDAKDRTRLLPLLYQLLDAGVEEDSALVLALAGRILEIEPENPTALASLGIELTRLNRFEEALPSLELLEERGRSSSRSLLALGRCYLAREELSAAADTLARVLAFAPTDNRALYWLAEVEARRQRPQAALELYRLLLENFTGPDGPAKERARADVQQRIAALEKALDPAREEDSP